MSAAISQPSGVDSQFSVDEGPDGVEAAARIVGGVLEIYPSVGTRVVVTRHEKSSRNKGGIALNTPRGSHSGLRTVGVSLPPGVLDDGTLIGGYPPRPGGEPESGIKVSVLSDHGSRSGYKVRIELGEGMHIMLFTHERDEVEVTAGAHGEVRRVAVWIPHDNFAPEQGE